MHQIFYVDIYLILNFMMNFFLLMLTAIIRQKKGIAGRIFLFSLFFAAISAGVTWIFWNEKIWGNIIALAELGVMLYVVYLPGTIKDWWRDTAIFLSLALFSGGGMTAFFSLGNTVFSKIPISSMGMIGISVLLMGTAFCLLRGQWALQRQNQQTIVWVEVFHGEKCFHAKALVDTGNRLKSPYTGEGVWIVSEELAGKLDLSTGSRPVYIPYQSLGGDGMWAAYRLDRVLVDNKKVYENVLVAVSPHLGEMDEIQMILNIMVS